MTYDQRIERLRAERDTARADTADAAAWVTYVAADAALAAALKEGP